MLTTGIVQIDSLKQRLYPDWAEERPVGGVLFCLYLLNGGEDCFRRVDFAGRHLINLLNLFVFLCPRGGGQPERQVASTFDGCAPANR